MAITLAALRAHRYSKAAPLSVRHRHHSYERKNW